MNARATAAFFSASFVVVLAKVGAPLSINCLCVFLKKKSSRLQAATTRRLKLNDKKISSHTN